MKLEIKKFHFDSDVAKRKKFFRLYVNNKYIRMLVIMVYGHGLKLQVRK